MRTLVVAAHPDDETLGCGGTIARLTARGEQVRVVILGEGITSRLPDRSDASPRDLAKLQSQSNQALGILGVTDIHFEGLPDQRFDTVALLDIVKILERHIEDFAPSRIYTHHVGDLNMDHAVAFRATATAARPVPGSPVRRICAYEVPSSTEWSPGKDGGSFRPNVFVDVSPTLDAKLEAMRAYAGEMRAFPHPRSEEAIRALAVWRGASAGVAAAEAFELVREVAG